MQSVEDVLLDTCHAKTLSKVKKILGNLDCWSIIDPDDLFFFSLSFFFRILVCFVLR